MANIVLMKPSGMSLLLRMRKNGRVVGSGTGIISMAKNGPVLVTNYHNLTALRPDNGQPVAPGAVPPDEVESIHHLKGQVGKWVSRIEPLYGLSRRWVEHPQLGSRADVVALPLSQLEDVDLHPYPDPDEKPIKAGPADPVSVVGFPFGMTAGGVLPIWATGFVASEPDINYDSLPVFLVDCRTRPGQSGSAVIAFRNGGMVPLQDGGGAMFVGPVFRFLGLYSGRINAESDIGMVWKAGAVAEVVGAVP